MDAPESLMAKTIFLSFYVLVKVKYQSVYFFVDIPKLEFLTLF